MTYLTRDDLDGLLRTLHSRDYTVLGPRRNGDTIMLETLRDVSDLPAGVTDEQSPGRYTLHSNGHPSLFSHTIGPLNWKRFLFPPERQLVRSRREDDGTGLSFDGPDEAAEPRPLAFVGVRPCDLAALAILDTVFLRGQVVDPTYAAARGRTFIVAVNCTRPADTCFCSSMNTGPAARAGYDLCLTEVTVDATSVFVCQTGSPTGEDMADELRWKTADERLISLAEKTLLEATGSIGRTIETEGLQEFLSTSHDNPEWEEVGKRCLTCANCTLVCPTCFCSSVDDITDLSGNQAERRGRWDSCFTLEFSHIHGGSVRQSASSRYRQWLTHKLGTWHSQFGTSGCVGCGRCITWCPVGIDITQEVGALRRASRLSLIEHDGD